MIQARNIDYATAKKWTPDYGNKENLGGTTTSYTATDTGWIAFSIECYQTGSSDPQIDFKMNNNTFAKIKGASTNSQGVKVIDHSTFFEITKGDTFSYSASNVAGYNLRELYFIPGRWA